MIRLGLIEVLDRICLDSRAEGINSYPESPVFLVIGTVMTSPRSNTVAKLEDTQAGHE